MTERPIIFSGPMVRAILDGRKSQTRRVLKPQPEHLQHHEYKGRLVYEGEHRLWCWKHLALENIWDFPDNEDRRTLAMWQPWQPGDLLWVRETHVIESTWSYGPPDPLPDDRPIKWLKDVDSGRYCLIPHYRATEPEPHIVPDDLPDEHDDRTRWRSPIHMPRWASRLTLRVTEVRVQRLQEISDGDARAEGATMRPNCSGFQSRYDGWSMDWSPVGTSSRWAKNGTLTERDISLSGPRWAFASYWNELHKPGARWEDNPWVCALTFERMP